jgi:hypothetical protein
VTQDNLFRGCGIEISLHTPEDFLKVKETLTRIGIASRVENTLYQSVHILHKRSRYVLIHFKELFKLDGRPTNISEDDYARRNTIACLLQEWGLVKILESESVGPVAPVHHITIISHKDKVNWKLVAKYTIGAKDVPKP